MHRMKHRYPLLVLGLILVATSVVIYLIQTGESGMRNQALSARTIDVTRLDATEIRKLGWKPKELDAVFDYAATLSTDSFIIVTNGQIVGAFGDLSKPYNVHSIRKVLLSAVVGQHAGTGAEQVPLDATLQELGIDDSPMPLLEVQKSATVNHLLQSTSGINHPAAAEGGLTAEKNRRLGDGENQPGAIWAYNNWDYNALTTIFENRTGLTVAEAFLSGIAEPADMKDFEVGAVSYVSDPKRSQHRSAAFQMSARDLAVFGQIYLDGGRLGDKHILPLFWVDRIVERYTETGRKDLRWGHGDLWWLPGPESSLPEDTFWGWGLGNQALFVIPAWDTVIVVQSDTTEFLKRFIPLIADGENTAEKALEELILSCIDPGHRESEYCVEHRFTTPREFEKLISIIRGARF